MDYKLLYKDKVIFSYCDIDDAIGRYIDWQANHFDKNKVIRFFDGKYTIKLANYDGKNYYHLYLYQPGERFPTEITDCDNNTVVLLPQENISTEKQKYVAKLQKLLLLLEQNNSRLINLFYIFVYQNKLDENELGLEDYREQIIRKLYHTIEYEDLILGTIGLYRKK